MLVCVFWSLIFNWPFPYASPCRQVQEKMAEPWLGIGGMADPATMADTRSKVVERGGFEPARRRPVGSTASFLNARAD
jgi:hypothetical protein